MITLNRKLLISSMIPILLTGCGIGVNKSLFITRTNVGMDVDARLATAQINIDRQEGVLTPVFEGGKVLPLAAAFNNSNRWLLGFGISSVFAGGRAAYELTDSSSGTKDKSDNVKENDPSTKCLTTRPVLEKGFLRRFIDFITNNTLASKEYEEGNFPGPGQVSPLVFNTDTSFGLKVAWSGVSGPYPDRVKVGFNREEFAYVPIIGTGSCGTDNAGFGVTMPSFLAAIDTDSELRAMNDSEFTFRQTFATGDAATHLSDDDQLKPMLKVKLAPDGGETGQCLYKWLSEDPKTINSRATLLSNWLDDPAHKSRTVKELVMDADEWKAFATANKITCK